MSVLFPKLWFQTQKRKHGKDHLGVCKIKCKLFDSECVVTKQN